MPTSVDGRKSAGMGARHEEKGKGVLARKNTAKGGI